MTYKTILVHADEDRGSEQRLALAARAAVTFEAHLVGLHVIRQPLYPTYIVADIPPALFEQQLSSLEDRAARSKARFEAACKGAGIDGEWRQLEDMHADPGGTIARQARYADLAIIGQTDPDDDQQVRDDIQTKVLMESGRPTLIVPYVGGGEKVATDDMRATVAWNASREATRAAFDAIPLLQKASWTQVLVIDARHTEQTEGPIPGADFAQVLARHGIRPEVAQDYAEDGHIGDLLLSRVADSASDLLVMGGYGRSRVRELILGGASRDVLRSMTVPVLISH